MRLSSVSFLRCLSNFWVKVTVHKPHPSSGICVASLGNFWPQSSAIVIFAAKANPPSLTLWLPELGKASDSLDLEHPIGVYSWESLQVSSEAARCQDGSSTRKFSSSKAPRTEESPHGFGFLVSSSLIMKSPFLSLTVSSTFYAEVPCA